jgi:hypothetical protein
VFQLEVEVVIVGVGTKPDLLNDDLYGLRLDLFLLLLLFVLKLGIIHNLADWWISIWRNLDEVQSLVLRQTNGLLNGINIDLDVLTYDPYPLRSYPLIDLVGLLRFLRTSFIGSVETRSVCAVAIDNC